MLKYFGLHLSNTESLFMSQLMLNHLMLIERFSSEHFTTKSACLLYTQYALHVFRGAGPSNKQCFFLRFEGSLMQGESAPAFMASVRRCDGRVQSGPRRHTSPSPLRSPSTSGTLLQTFVCPAVPVCRQVQSTSRAGRGTRQKMWTALS